MSAIYPDTARMTHRGRGGPAAPLARDRSHPAQVEGEDVRGAVLEDDRDAPVLLVEVAGGVLGHLTA